MTTERPGASCSPASVAFCAWLLVLLAAGAMSCAGTQENRHGDRLDVSSYPKEIQDAYPVFARRCARCHTLARPLNARISDPEHWRRYVARMRRQSGSGINEKNAAVILRFLSYYATEVRGGGGAALDGYSTPDEAAAPPATEAPEVTSPGAPMDNLSPPAADADAQTHAAPDADAQTHAAPDAPSSGTSSTKGSAP